MTILTPTQTRYRELKMKIFCIYCKAAIRDIALALLHNSP